jgi:branched-chain amino acid transport system substrate-binding protein
MDLNDSVAPPDTRPVEEEMWTQGPPADVRTFLIADVRGYTRFTQEHGDEAAAELAATFAERAGKVVEAGGGQVIEIRGDEALSVFGSARQALRAAVELQRQFREAADGRPAFPLGIGIGLDSGEAVPVAGGFRGTALNLASRLCSLAAPGQILATQTVVSLAHKVDGVRFAERRPVRVKGIDKPVRLIEVVPEAELPPVPQPSAPSLWRRIRRDRRALALFVLGLLLVVASIVAVLVKALGAGSETHVVGNAVAALDSAGGRVVSYTEVGTSPTNVVVGDGAVWVLNADDQTVSQIDPDTRRIVKTFGTGETPTDIAVGEDAVWVGNAAVERGQTLDYTASISKIDPQTAVVTRKVVLPKRTKELPPNGVLPGVSQLAIAAGSLWVINPDFTVSRMNPATGDLLARVPVTSGAAIAASDDRVWLVGGEDFASVVRIDPKTNRPGQRIEVNASFLADIELGAGSVWASAPDDGVVWRIEPGPDPIARTISVGRGATSISFAEGVLWVANTLDGTVLRIDPATNEVMEAIPIAGTPLGVAAAEDNAWVTLVGGTTSGALPSSACGSIESGGREPDVLIASDLPLRGDVAPLSRSMTAAIRFVLRSHDFKAGEHTVGYQSCDDSTSQTNRFDFFKCSANAKAYAGAKRLVGIIGTLNSGCAVVEIPIVNRAPGGPVPMISPANTYVGLTHAGPGADPRDPEALYPTGVRNYVRVTSPDDLQGAAQAVLAKRLGLRSVFVVEDGDEYGTALRQTFSTAARRLGVDVAGTAAWDGRAPSYADLADRIRRSGAEGVFVAGVINYNGIQLVRDLRAGLGPDVVLTAGDGFPLFELLHGARQAAIGMYMSTTAIAVQQLSPAGGRFVDEFAPTQPNGAVSGYVLETAQAAEVLLEAISRSDGSRASVLEELRKTEVQDGILGDFRFDANGDKTPGAITIYRVTGKSAPDAGVPPEYEGAVFDRTLAIPANLLP